MYRHRHTWTQAHKAHPGTHRHKHTHAHAITCTPPANPGSTCPSQRPWRHLAAGTVSPTGSTSAHRLGPLGQQAFLDKRVDFPLQKRLFDSQNYDQNQPSEYSRKKSDAVKRGRLCPGSKPKHTSRPAPGGRPSEPRQPTLRTGGRPQGRVTP